MSEWIDFKQFRETLRFEDVLALYGVPLRRKGNQHLGPCPLPGHTARTGPPTFSVNLEKGCFQCFGCRTKGNTLEFAVLMEGKDPRQGRDIRAVALSLRERLESPDGAPEPAVATVAKPTESKNPTPKSVTVINAPLDFELKGLDHEHPYLRNLGFHPETIRHFGLGVAPRGLLKGMLAVPLHTPKGQLIGYAGHPVDGSADILKSPRFRFPEPREHKGIRYELRPERLLYNVYRIQAPVTDLVVVRNMATVWWMHQCGVAAIVAWGGDCKDLPSLLAQAIAPRAKIWTG